VPQPNVVELVPAGHLTCEIDLGGDHLTRPALTVLNATDAAADAARIISAGL
jgi:hypothetical protein